MNGDLASKLRLLVLTRPEPPAGPLLDVVGACLEAGCRAIQIRDKRADAARLLATARSLLSITRPAGALLFVNDRLDVALAAGADGVHLGPDDLPVAAARRIVPPDFVIGASTDDPSEARSLARQGADYLGVGAVYGTTSRPGLEHETIGPARVAEVRAASGLPCVGIGGITPETASDVYATGAGVAVLSAVMDADNPASVVRELLRLAP